MPAGESAFRLTPLIRPGPLRLDSLLIDATVRPIPPRLVCLLIDTIDEARPTEASLG